MKSELDDVIMPRPGDRRGPVRRLNDDLQGMLMYSAAPTFADLLDKLFAEQSARIAKIEAEHAKWEGQLEKMLAETNAIIKSLAADIMGGR